MIVGPKRLEPTGFMESTRAGGNTMGDVNRRIIQNLPARLRIFVAWRHPVWFRLRRPRKSTNGLAARRTRFPYPPQCRFGVKGYPCDYVGITAGVPPDSRRLGASPRSSESGHKRTSDDIAAEGGSSLLEGKPSSKCGKNCTGGCLDCASDMSSIEPFSEATEKQNHD